MMAEMLGQRDRDTLHSQPLLPGPPKLGQARQRMGQSLDSRKNSTVVAVGQCGRGEFEAGPLMSPPFGTADRWEEASEEVAERILEIKAVHREQLQGAPDMSEEEAVELMTRLPPSDYGAMENIEGFRVPMKGQALARGDVIGTEPENVNFPEPGNAPTEAGEISSDVRQFFANPTAMLAGGTEELRQTRKRTRGYTDPRLKNRAILFPRPSRMWVSGMNGFCAECCEYVSVFAVVKKIHAATASAKDWVEQRLVFDGRAPTSNPRLPCP